MTFQTLTIGRRRDADIRLTDMSVSRMHAEVTIAGDGRCFLIDCGSSRGTWTKSGNDEWTRHRQGYVEVSSPVRFGGFETRLRKLAALTAALHRRPGAERMEG